MSAERDLAGTISDMEEDVHWIVAMAHALTLIGEGIAGDDGKAVGMSARVLYCHATDLHDRWRRAFDLSRPGASS